MSTPEVANEQVTHGPGGVRRRHGREALAWIGYLVGVAGVLFFGPGGVSVIPIAGCGMALAVAACLCWAAVGRTVLGITGFVLLGLCFYIGSDPLGAIQTIADYGPTYFGCCRQ